MLFGNLEFSLFFIDLDLMKLKKMNVAKQAGKSPTKGDGKKGDALISRYVAAMCFDFHPDDGNL